MDPQDTYDPPAEPANPPAGPISNDPLASAEPGAQLVCEIRRHPIGILGLYVGAGFLMLVLAIVIFVVAPNVLSGYSRGQVMSIGSLVFAAAAVIAAGFVFVAHKVYWGNRWIVSNESITQVVKTGLFNKQTSQLSLGNLEDLTAQQDGLLAELFHYGIISAETAAATDKFTFPYCPKPTYYAQQILAARDRFEQSHQQNSQPTPQPTPPPAPTGTDYPAPG